jgi:hypothetical protein
MRRSRGLGDVYKRQIHILASIREPNDYRLANRETSPFHPTVRVFFFSAVVRVAIQSIASGTLMLEAKKKHSLHIL